MPGRSVLPAALGSAVVVLGVPQVDTSTFRSVNASRNIARVRGPPRRGQCRRTEPADPSNCGDGFWQEQTFEPRLSAACSAN
jgi:hypothetical protein